MRQLYNDAEPEAVVTIESRTTNGWAHDVLFGKGPWIQIQLRRDLQSVYLNLGKKRPAGAPDVPATWPQEKNRMWVVKREETESLVDWMCRWFTALSGADNLRTVGFMGC